jgi:hypothetical protein
MPLVSVGKIEIKESSVPPFNVWEQRALWHQCIILTCGDGTTASDVCDLERVKHDLEIKMGLRKQILKKWSNKKPQQDKLKKES